MRLESVKVALPSRMLTNQDILSLIEQHSKEIFQGNLDKALEKILLYLKYSGSEYRYWLEEGETPIRLLSKAVHEALEEAGCTKQDIDLLIYTGVNRGFLEPGGSYHSAMALGMERVHCFDILDACMSWSRALYLAQSLLEKGDYKRIMIINAEFSMHEGGPVYPAVFKLPSIDAIEWSFPAYTLGEAATATIVSYDPELEWEFHFASRADFSDLCTVPLQGFEGYCHPTKYTGRNGVGYFTSFGFDLHKKGSFDIVEIFQQLKVPIEEIKAIFPHGSSKTAWNELGKIAGIEHLIWHIYPHCGNVVSASLPTGLASAIDEKHIQRGDRIAGWVGSAGMSFCAFSSIY